MVDRRHVVSDISWGRLALVGQEVFGEHWSGYRIAVAQAVLLEDLFDVGILVDPNSVIGQVDL